MNDVSVLRYAIVIRGDWLWKATNINDKNNSAAFSIFDSFDHLPPVLAADTEKSAPKSKTSGTLGIQEGKKKYWTNVKTTPNMDRVMGTWFGLLNNRHMIKNKELEFKHRWYILQQTREDTLAFLYLYRKVRREVDILQSWGRDFELILGQIVSMREKLHGNTNLVVSCYIEKKHDSFPVDVRRLKTFLLKPCRNICITGKRQILISFQNLRSFSSWCVKYHNKRNRSAYKL